MKLFSAIALAFAGSAALAAPAFAADAPAPGGQPSSIVVHMPNGKTAVIPADSKMAQHLMADPESKPLKEGIIVYVVNGKSFFVFDHKMSNGKMMSQALMDYDAPEGGG
jgi:hypothetical protein